MTSQEPVKTVPPEGVKANFDSLWLNDVETAHAAKLEKKRKQYRRHQYA